MIVVTGGAGFIGSNLILGLNKAGIKDILVVDDLTDGKKFANLVECEYFDYLDRFDFLELIKSNSPKLNNISAIFHQGACSETTNWDGNYMLKNNYQYSKDLLDYCNLNNIQFIYASSAAVYGASTNFKEEPANEKPLNVYGYSKLMFDNYVRTLWQKNKLSCQVVGLRYFNVYGPNEAHKDTMASCVWHFSRQLLANNKLNLFGENAGIKAGEQKRDFVFVDDLIDLNLWCWQNSSVSGIFNAGTGKAQTFNELALAVINYFGKGEINYIDFPDHLKNCYQDFTQADLTSLRAIGYDQQFCDVNAGVAKYLTKLEQ